MLCLELQKLQRKSCNHVCYLLLCPETLNEMKYNPCKHLHQDAEVKKLEDKLSFLTTEKHHLFMLNCQPIQAAVWEILHCNFLTCHNLQHLLIHHLL